LPRTYLLGGLDEAARHRPRLLAAIHGFEGGLFRSVLAVAGRLPVDRASAAGGALARRLGPRSRKHRMVIDNLGFVRPDWSALERHQAALGVWDTMGRTIAELPHLQAICHDLAAGRVEVVERGDLEAVRRGRRPAIFVGAHLGNWNLAPIAPHRLGIPLAVLFRSQSNTLVEGLIAPHRAATGAAMIPADDGGRAMLAALRGGTSVGLFADFRVDEGELVPFFGVPAPTVVGPARIALKLELPYVPVEIERLDGARFRITFHEAIEPVRGLPPREAALRMVAEMNRRFEGWIRARPAQWFCTRRRWPLDAVPAAPQPPPLPLAA
jgi:KDO2-lipid IV(A) lauroyltransferase